MHNIYKYPKEDDNLFKWIKDKIKQENTKKGINSLTMVAGVIMAFIAIGGLADLTILQTKFSVVSAQTGYISRTIADQGGVTTKKINNYHGKYITSQELYFNVKDAMNNSGIADGEWGVYIDGKELTPTTSVRVHNYGEKIPITVSIDYRWAFSSKFLPGSLNNTRTSRTESLSSYRIRDKGFEE